MSFRSVLLKTPLWSFWQLLTFFSAFYKILTKTTFVCLIFLKLKQKKKNLIKNLTKNISSYFSKKIKSLHPTGESCFGGFFTDSPRYDTLASKKKSAKTYLPRVWYPSESCFYTAFEEKLDCSMHGIFWFWWDRNLNFFLNSKTYINLTFYQQKI